ncbi:uridylate-specific endoribonuclease B-like [Rhopilema esculentum]|uniref:uridylate-specific endoribonuclease B-like n=1 Tax=Rhopilema esculentum TaxID=499914 RepID=UPI0031DCA48F|eukprot:gene9493-17227_t
MLLYKLVLLLGILSLASCRRNRYRRYRFRKYFNRRSCGSYPSAITESELKALGEQIWREDTNRVQHGIGFRLDMQTNAGYNGVDYASRPLFKFVNQSVLQKPSVRAMVALFDNYKRAIGSSEYVSSGERSENWNFLNTVTSTRPMELVYQFLLRKKVVCSLKDFKNSLYNIWFNLYARRSSKKRYTSGLDSSGFEHVFVGETDSSKVLGLHNWIQFYLQEKNRNIDYKGYKGYIKQSSVFTCQFSWYGLLKSIGGAFVGTSPEFDFAIYSLTFMSKVRNPIYTFGGDRVRVKCYGIAGGKIGTCYPILL